MTYKVMPCIEITQNTRILKINHVNVNVNVFFLLSAIFSAVFSTLAQILLISKRGSKAKGVNDTLKQFSKIPNLSYIIFLNIVKG